ncbi:DUF4974 domain-containing protein [Polaribacter batillariae]|uniref:DUF4974 domain-containing protein n=1 Tax=Polaribacter batillariae TaxID=2808900 RepID=A0ABX7SY16_9FLAO|nr:FecR domain-containing protein [Polaribacter batillariae]QTD39157.1 DUF4974 domain-containing protein [Polaribacter batillariae]
MAYNTLNVPYGKTFELRLSDGTVVHLNAGSSITYPVEFIEGKNRQVSITGEAYVNVTKDSLHPFIVSLNDLNVRVLGTQFNVSAYPEDNVSEIVLVEGSVAMYGKKEKFNKEASVLLEPGFKGRFNKQNHGITKNKVITSTYTSWVNGKLVFRNMTFENILKKLERHYNVNIVNKNKTLSQKKFNANFGKEPLANVLNELKKYYGVQYGMPTKHKIPTLEKVLKLCKDKILVFLDKGYEYVPEVMFIVQKLNMQNQIFFEGKHNYSTIKSRYGTMLKDRNYMPRAKVNRDTAKFKNYVFPFLKSDARIFICSVDSAEVSYAKPFIQKIKSKNKKIMLTTLWGNTCAGYTDDAAVNNPEANWGKVIDLGADLICTDRPKMLLEYLRKKELHN